jgi:hypothetical protein
MGITDRINQVNELSRELFREVWGKRLVDVSRETKRSYFADRVPRSSDGIDGTTVNIPFLTRIPIAWSALNTVDGYTPSGGKFAVDSQVWSLGCCAASVMLSYDMITNSKLNWAQIGDAIQFQLSLLAKSLPYYERALLWSSSAADKAIGKQAGSASGATVTLDNDGLWHTNIKDRAKLFEPGM